MIITVISRFSTLLSQTPPPPDIVDPRVVLAIASLIVAILVLLFGNAILFRFRDWLAKRRDSSSDVIRKENMAPITERLTVAVKLVSEAKKLIPQNPPFPPQDVEQTRTRLTEARDIILQITASEDAPTDLRLTLEAIVDPSSALGEVHFEKVLAGCYRLAQYSRPDFHDVTTVARELAQLDNLVTKLQTRLGKIRDSLDKMQ